jgi:hypothetical protein
VIDLQQVTAKLPLALQKGTPDKSDKPTVFHAWLIRVYRKKIWSFQLQKTALFTNPNQIEHAIGTMVPDLLALFVG